MKSSQILFPLLICLLSGSLAAQNSGYILTPAPSKSPRINGAAVFGVRPHSPVIYKIAATGEKPLTYAIRNLPGELALDPETGMISGKFDREGTHVLKVTVSNRHGKASRDLTIRVGPTISLTPPMGWNSWNAFGESVSQEKMMAAARAMVDRGLIDHGWTYVNIDDGWQGVRDANGVLQPNNKFPDMKGLSDWIHALGMKFGIYSSPGPTSCVDLPGSWQHEELDAKTWAGWNIDFLKYDLCSYKWDIYDKQKDTSEAAWTLPFLTMRRPLDNIQRDIIYSICSYNTIPWAAKVGANLTRLTGDNRDAWQTISSTGPKMDPYRDHQRPGLWNDADMLVVGSSGGWEGKPRPNHMTPDEQYFHVSLWALLSTPLIIGCDLTTADDFTMSLLTNDEVIDIDQDPLAKPARMTIRKPEYQVWVKDLADGTHAVGFFNYLDVSQKVEVQWADLGIRGGKVRDLWRQKNLGRFAGGYMADLRPHGAQLIRISR